MSDNKWFVITGGPSVGKTTLINELARLGYRTVPEAARVLIDSSLESGVSIEDLRKDEEQFQRAVTYLKEKAEANQKPGQVTFFDRGMHDTLAYMQLHGFEISDDIRQMMRPSSYRAVFLLDPLPIFEKDYARVETREFTVKLNALLYDVYKSYDMQPIRIPASSIGQRLNLVLKYIGENAP